MFFLKLLDWLVIRKSFFGLKEFVMKGKFFDVIVKEVVVNILVVVEIVFWFYVGEVIGRWSLIGYDVWLIVKLFYMCFCFWFKCVEKLFFVFCVKLVIIDLGFYSN